MASPFLVIQFRPKHSGHRFFPWVHGRNDGADGILIETLEATLALKIFQMASDRAFGREFLKLGLIDRTLCEQLFGS